MERNNKLCFMIISLFLMAFLSIANAARAQVEIKHGPRPTKPGPFGARYPHWLHGTDGPSGPDHGNLNQHGPEDHAQPNPFGIWAEPRIYGSNGPRPEENRPKYPAQTNSFGVWAEPEINGYGRIRPISSNGPGTGEPRPNEPLLEENRPNDPNFLGPGGLRPYGPWPGYGWAWPYGPGFGGYPPGIIGRLFPWARILFPWLSENLSATEGRVSDPALVKKLMREILRDGIGDYEQNP